MRRRSIVTFALLASLLLVVTIPVSAAHAPDLSINETAAELGNGTFDNAEVEREGGGSLGFVGYDVSRADATARWAFDEGSGSTAYDHVGTNDGTITGATWTTGVSGQALNFDGADDEVDTGVASLTTPFVISAWVNPDDSTAGRVVSNYDSSADDLFFQADGNDDFRFLLDAGGDVTAINALTAGTWTHVVGVVEGGTLYLYVDGALIGTDSAAPADGTTINSGSNFFIGSSPGGTPFEGQIDDVRFYGAGLSPGQISRLYRNPNPKLSANATERWAFDAGTGTTAFGDEGSNGTFFNSPTWTAGIAGNALDFNASNSDGVEGTSPASHDIGTGSYTITAWVNPDNCDSGDGRNTIFHQAEAAGPLDSAWLQILAGTTDCDVDILLQDDDTATTDRAIGGPLPLDSWSLVTAVYDTSAGELRLYVNETEVADDNALEVGEISGFSEWAIGKRAIVDERYFDGEIDDVRIYSGTALQPDQIQWLYDHPGAQLNDTGTYAGADHAVTNSVSGWTDFELDNATATVTWTNGNGATLASTTVSTTQNLSQAWARDSTSAVNVTVVFEPTDPVHTARLFDEGVSADTFAPTVDNASLSPNTTATTVDGLPVTLSADVNDSDFPTGQGDSVTAEFFVDGTSEGTDTLTANGTATVDVSSVTGGTHDWNVTLTDEYGHSVTSATAQFAAPANISIREESEPHDIITSAAGVEIAIFGQDGTLDNRTVTDGNISTTDLPTDESFVFLVNADGYHVRTVIIESVFEQDDIYLLNETHDSVNITVTIEDRTGRFGQGESQLFMKHVVNESGNLTKVDVAGENVSALGVAIDMRQNERYFFELENAEGDVADLGAVVADESFSGQTINMIVTAFDSTLNETSDFAWNATYEVRDGQADRIRFFWNATLPGETADDFNLTVFEFGNRSNTIYNVDHGDGISSLDVFITVTDDNATWAVSWNATYNGNDESGGVVLGNERYITTFPMDDVWKQRIAIAGIIVIVGLFSLFNAGIGAFTGATLAGLGWYMGVLPDEVGAGVIMASAALAAVWIVKEE